MRSSTNRSIPERNTNNRHTCGRLADTGLRCIAYATAAATSTHDADGYTKGGLPPAKRRVIAERAENFSGQTKCPTVIPTIYFPNYQLRRRQRLRGYLLL
jgi:hypothetical protein